MTATIVLLVALLLVVGYGLFVVLYHLGNISRLLEEIRNALRQGRS